MNLASLDSIFTTQEERDNTKVDIAINIMNQNFRQYITDENYK